MQKRNSSNFSKIAFIALFGAMMTVATFKAVSKSGTNLLQGVLSPLPPSSLLVGSSSNSQNDGPIDEAKFFAIEWTSSGVDLVLHRPEDVSTDAVEVTLVGSTNLVTATWEPFMNVTFPAGDTNVAVTVTSAMLDVHSVDNACFFAFINAGDSDGDGLADWDERFNLKTDPDEVDSDGDGMPDGWEHSHGLDPRSRQDASQDADDDGVPNFEEYVHGTDPQSDDTDGDGLSDLEELGWVQQVASTSLPIANDNTVYICTPPVGLVSFGVYPFTLPFPIRLCGRICTHGYADVKGVVHFLSDGNEEVPSPLGDNGPLPSASLSGEISVAAYWDNLCLHGGVSSIRLSDVTVDGRRYAVVEYHSVGAASADLDLLTFRVAVCQQRDGEVVVQYGALDDPHEGRSATFGAQGPGMRPCLMHSCNGANSLADGVSLVYHLGTGTDPCDADTDGDGMPDGWEHESGLLPNSAEGDDGASGDPDGDGLSNWVECILGTMPLDRYSFGDDIEDQDWVAWGFGMPVPDYTTVQVAVGDPSTSASERWKLHLSDVDAGGRHYVVACSESGQVACRTLHLERGRYFTGWLEHAGSSQETPDYDWSVQIDGWPSSTVLPQGVAQTDALRYHEDHVHSLIVDNVDGLLGICNEAFDSYDNSHGKMFLLHTVKTHVATDRVVVPEGFAFRTPFSLTEDSDQIADWTIEPQTADGAHLYVSASGGEGANSLQGMARVYVSPGANPGLYTITARHPTFENSHSTATFAVCKFKVEGVRFNYDRNSSANDAINIRSNYDTLGFDYSTGEWANGGQVNFPVCYKGGITPKMQAKLSVMPTITVSVRFFAGQIATPSPVGGVFEENVQFTNGESDWVVFTGARPVEAEVARGEAVFDWRLSGIEGSPFVPTTVGVTGPHRVYVVLADPVEPWSSNHESDQCAWTNALEWACAHAEGTVDETHCASSIVDAIFSSGRFRYDVVEGDTRFTGYSGLIFPRPEVYLTRCIQTLNDASLSVAPVNCTDCASFVTSFANLLGCNLYNSKMKSETGFPTNPFCAIGCSPWTPPDWGWGFSFHEVAWSGECSSSDLIFDACLRYDGDDDPTSSPYTQLSPAGVQFSDGHPGPPLVYRDRLVPAVVHGLCQPDPSSKVRRKVK